jgi:CDP-diacylglycerol--glycerol-3-phosphate 3-phosphatidyltransferase/cardiolipin synthase
MGRFRARDVWLVPSLLSLARLPLAVAFPLIQPWRVGSFLILVLAGGSDVLDGWYARRFNQVTPTGAVLDPVTDKLFALSVVVTLVMTKALPVMGAVLLTTREIGELPLLLWFLLSPRAWRARATKAAANVPGKLATTLQFVSIVAALMRSSYTEALLFVTAGAGAGAAVAYWMREIAATRERAPERT